MFYRRFISFVAVLALAQMVTASTFAAGFSNEIPTDKTNTTRKNSQTSEPLNLAILVQDDLVSQVGMNSALRATSYALCQRVSSDGRLHNHRNVADSTTVYERPGQGSSFRCEFLAQSTSASPFNPYVE